MSERRKQYESIEAEAQDRGIPVWLVEHERRINQALNRPEFLDAVNETLFGRESTAPASPPADSLSEDSIPHESQRASRRGRRPRN